MEFFATITIPVNEQEKALITPLNIEGGPATVDPSGFVKASVNGGGDVIIDPRDPAGNLRLIVKPDTSGAELPSTSQVVGTVDMDAGEGVVQATVTFTIVTTPLGAATLTIENGGREPLNAEVIPA